MTAGALPNLLLAGVQKAGTTSLFRYLAHHPEVCPATVKEPGYFTPLSVPGTELAPLATYTALFAHCDGARYRMEASPTYALGGRPVIEGIRRTLRDPRIVISLRDPIDRLWSAYTYSRSLGSIPDIRSCDEFITVSLERRRAGTDRTPGQRRVAVATGMYHEYLPAWLDAFGDDLRVVFAERLYREPEAVLAELSDWLGLPPGPLAGVDTTPQNPTRKARSQGLARVANRGRALGERVLGRAPRLRRRLRAVYDRLNTTDLDETLRPETRARLGEIYAESIARTAELLRSHGYGALPGWLEADPGSAPPARESGGGPAHGATG